MKTYVWIIIAVILLAGAGGGFWYFQKKKKDSGKISSESDSNSEKNKTKSVGSDQVAAIQKKVNSQLPSTYISPSTGRNKIVEDGIWGPESKHALEFISGKKADGLTQDAIENLVNAVRTDGKEGLKSMVDNSPTLALVAGLWKSFF